MINWVKIKDSDRLTHYPCHIRIDYPDGKWSYEPDKTRPEVRKVAPKLLEDNGNGTYTEWEYSVWGAIGQTGTMTKTVIPLKTKADFAEAKRLERMIERATRLQSTLYSAMKKSDTETQKG